MTDIKNTFYAITNHARERYLQRTRRKYKHMRDCRQENCETCLDMLAEIRVEIDNTINALNTEIMGRIAASDEDRSYINNVGYMQWYYEKYGFDKRFQFLVHEDILFVVVDEPGKKVVVTAVPSKTHFASRHSVRKPKFSKVQKKEDKDALA
jgi:hypothetical protein